MTSGAKRILMLTHEFPPMRGGISRYAVELANAATQLGHHVTVLAPDNNCDCSQYDYSCAFKIQRYRGAAYGPLELPSLILRTAFVQSSAYDIVHAVDPSFVMALAFVQRFKRIDYHATVYGTDILGLRTSIQATATGTRRMFEYPSRLVAISDFTRSLLMEKCPKIPSDRIDVTPLGVHPSWFESAGPNKLASRFDIPESHRLLLTVSRLDSRKGHRTVLQALSHMTATEKHDLTYAIVGEGTDRAYQRELEHLAATTGCSIRFLGALDDDKVRSLYARADLFCMPGEPDNQKVEGFGLVYLEAAAQGLPSLASTVGAVPEVVIHGETGWLVPPSDPLATANALSGLLSNSNKLKRMGTEARRRALTFTWSRCALLTYGEAA